MRVRTLFVFANVIALSAVTFALLAQSSESLFGTWKLNLAKSKYSPGPAPKSGTAKWEAYQGGVKLTVDNEFAKGETQHWEVSGMFDGKENPVKGNYPDGDAAAFSKIDARTYELAQKKGGKATITSRIVVAADGKTRITTSTGKDAKGAAVNNTQFYDKQ